MAKQQTKRPPIILPNDETELLVLSLAQARSPSSFSAAEAGKVVDWAAGVRSEQAVLGMVLRGELLVNLDAAGELVFSPRRPKP